MINSIKWKKKLNKVASIAIVSIIFRNVTIEQAIIIWNEKYTSWRSTIERNIFLKCNWNSSFKTFPSKMKRTINLNVLNTRWYLYLSNLLFRSLVKILVILTYVFYNLEMFNKQ